MRTFEFEIGQGFQPFALERRLHFGGEQADYHLMSPEIHIREAAVIRVALARIPDDPKVLQHLAYYDPRNVSPIPIPITRLTEQQQETFGLIDITMVEFGQKLDDDSQFNFYLGGKGLMVIRGAGDRLFTFPGNRKPRHIIMEPLNTSFVRGLHIKVIPEAGRRPPIDLFS